MLTFNKNDISELYYRVDSGADIDKVIGLFYYKNMRALKNIQDEYMLRTPFLSPSAISFIRICQYEYGRDIVSFDEARAAIELAAKMTDPGDITSEVYLAFHNAIAKHLKKRRKGQKSKFNLAFYTERAIQYKLKDWVWQTVHHYESIEIRPINDDELIHVTTFEEELIHFLINGWELTELSLMPSPIDRYFIYMKLSGYSVDETAKKLFVNKGKRGNVIHRMFARFKLFKQKAGKYNVADKQQNTCATDKTT